MTTALPRRWCLRPPLAVALAAALLAAGPARAESIRCDGGLVSEGDSKVDLLGKCGEPSLREAHSAEREQLVTVPPPARPPGQTGQTGNRRDPAALAPVSGTRLVTSVERWTYNFGPGRFVQYVTLEAGKVRKIERGSYGYEVARSGEPVALPRARCSQLGFHVGDSTFDTLARCGEPASRDEKVVERIEGVVGPDGSRTATVTSTVEIWTYDFGPQVLVRRLVFRDGTLRRIDTGSWGYSRE